MTKALNCISIKDLICINAERKSYGLRSKESILYEDEQRNAYWSWEITNTSLLPMNVQKTVTQVRMNR